MRTADTTAWETYHRRSAALRGLLPVLDAIPDGELPWTDELAEVFTDRDDLLVALHDLWTRRLEARIDLALELHDVPELSVAEAWREVAAELPGARRVLDAHRDDEALRAHELHENRLVAVAVGLASLADPVGRSAALGRAFVDRARSAVVPAQRDGWLAERLGGWFRRLPASA